MNILIVGSDKRPILEHLPDTFLFIDDKIDLPRRKNKQLAALIEGAKVFDVKKHSFNPLDGIDHKSARDFANTVYPDKDLMTYRNGKRALVRMLLKGERLDRLPEIEHDGYDDARATVDDLLVSPVVKHILCRPTNFTFKGTIYAPLDRAVLGDEDCFVIANLLISQYRGHVVLPDFGFYQTKSHSVLLRQNRLVAGINSFDEVPNFKQRLLQVETKIASRCVPQDAEILAVYEGLIQDPTRRDNPYNRFIQEAIS